jgi:hypothetical protein
MSCAALASGGGTQGQRAGCLPARETRAGPSRRCRASHWGAPNDARLRAARRARGLAVGRPKALDPSKAALARRMQTSGEPVKTTAATLECEPRDGLPCDRRGGRRVIPVRLIKQLADSLARWDGRGPTPDDDLEAGKEMAAAIMSLLVWHSSQP